MKGYIFPLLTTVLLFSGCVGQQAATEEEMRHEYVVHYMGMPKKVIFDRTLKWIANNFTSSKAVIEYQDSSTGSIVGNGVAVANATFGVYILFTMDIDIKDNRARYRFINLKVRSADTEPFAMPDNKGSHAHAKEIFDDIVYRLQEATNKSDDF